MRLKVLLLAVFVAGIAASIALASDGRRHGEGQGTAAGCTEVHVSGTIPAQALTVTADRTREHSGIVAGQTVTLTLGGAGQTVRVQAEACMTGTGTTAQLLVKELEAHAFTPGATTTTTTTTTPTTTTGATTTTSVLQAHRGDDGGGEHHSGRK